MGGLDGVIAKLRAADKPMMAAAAAQLAVEAPDLAKAIQGRAPVRSGTLRITVAARRISDGEWEVVAGGELTTKKVRKGVKAADFRTAKAGYLAGVFKNGGEFDYARAEEFNHVAPNGRVVPGQPFFFPTYRVKRSGILHRIEARVLDAARAYDLS